MHKKYHNNIYQTKYDGCDYLCENPYVNTNEENIIDNEEICKTNQSKESKNKSTN